MHQLSFDALRELISKNSIQPQDTDLFIPHTQSLNPWKQYERSIKKEWENENTAKFVCCLTLFLPNGDNYSSKGIIKGKISPHKKGINGFGYDPIFIPDGFTETFGEMNPKLKMTIDHRSKAFLKIKNFFN